MLFSDQLRIPFWDCESDCQTTLTELEGKHSQIFNFHLQILMGLLQAVLKRVACGRHKDAYKISGTAAKYEDTRPAEPAERALCELCKDPSQEVHNGAMSGCNHQFCQPCLQKHMTRQMESSMLSNRMPGIFFCPSQKEAWAWEFSRTEVLGVIGEQAMAVYEDGLMHDCDKIYSRRAGRIASALGKIRTRGKQTCELYRALVALEEQMCRFPQNRGRKGKAPSTPAAGKGIGFGGGREEVTGNANKLREEEAFYRELAARCADVRNNLDGCCASTPAGRLDCETWVLLQRAGTLPKMFHRLLSNDSILDVSSTTTCDCYLELLALLATLGAHDGLLPELFLQSGRRADQGQNAELGQELLNHMGALQKQAKVVLATVEAAGCSQEAPTEHESKLAQMVCQSYETLTAQWVKHGCQSQAKQASDSKCQDNPKTVEEAVDAGTGTTILPGNGALSGPEDVEQQYKEALRPLQFRSVDMAGTDGAYQSHFYSTKIRASTSGHTDRKRILRIAEELATLASSLPLEWGSSIHLCVDETRTDVMRALIVGPERTPYQNGVFLFDIFLPHEYPHIPPSVQFLTTGGGTVRFNPNLYRSGLVCLSLLGTWASGPGWMPGQSTLLQVLVSLQSLVFNEEPFYNEPGAMEQGTASTVYNDNTRRNTLSVAVLGALRQPDPHFADTIRHHFRFKREEIEQQCNSDAWARTSQIAKHIKQELQRLYGPRATLSQPACDVNHQDTVLTS